MEITIRRAREDDAQSMLELLNPIIQAGMYTVMDGPVSLADQLDFIRTFPERGVFHVAVDTDSQNVLGMQDIMPFVKSVSQHVGEISTFVSLTSHRTGIGRNLCQATFRAAKEHGFLKISASVRADNPAAQAFYLSQGFRVIGTAQKHVFILGRLIDEILMERFMDPSQ